MIQWRRKVWGIHGISYADKMCLNETKSKAHTDKYLSDNFAIENGLRQGDGSSQLLSNFALEYAIRTGQDIQVRLKLNGTHQLLAFAGNENILGGGINTINKDKESSVYASKEDGLEINVEKTKLFCRVFTKMQVKTGTKK
jgi:hypothetical protein